MIPACKRNTSLFARLLLALSLLVPAVLLAGIAAASGQTGVSTIEVDPGQDPNATAQTPVWSIVEGNGRIYIGGVFTTVEGVTQSYVAAVNANTGQLDTNFDPVVAGGNTTINTIALSPDGNDLYIGGIFQTVNGVPRERIAKIDAFSGALDTAFNPGASAEIESIVVDSTGVYVGGRFNTIAGASSQRLARLNPFTGQLDTAFSAMPNGNVLDLELFNNNLYVGGNFSSISGQSHDNFVRLQTATGAVHPSWNPAQDPPERVQAIALSDDGQRVFVGTAGSLSNGRNGNSAWAYTTSGTRLWQVALSGDVQALEAVGNTVYVGTHGNFVFDELRFQLDGTSLNPNFPANGYVESDNNANADRRDKLFSLNASTGALLPWDPSLDSVNGVWEINYGPSGLLVGGDFTEVRNPTGVGGALDTIDAEHVAIFPNPVAVAPPVINPPAGGGNGDFSCTVTTNGNNATVTYSGDRGSSNQLLQNGSWIGTVTNSTSNTINGGAGDTFAVRVRGDAYANPFQDITCGGAGGPVTPPPVTPPAGGGDFACVATASGNNVTVTYSGDRGATNQLLRNGSWIGTVTNDTSTFVSGGAGDTYTARVRGAAYADPFQDITCTNAGGTPVTPPPVTPPAGGGDFACVATTNGNNVTITYSGDRGNSSQLRRNGSFETTVTNDTSTFISGGAGDNYVVRVRGAAYADPFQDITCTTAGGGTPVTPPPAGASVCPATMPLGAIERGIPAIDSASGTGYLLWSSQPVLTRFNPPPLVRSADHLIAVQFINGQWHVDNNATLTPFTPAADDCLVAELDFTNDTATTLQGTNTTINGIGAGYATGDLQVFADQLDGVFNIGEFDATGTQILTTTTPATGTGNFACVATSNGNNVTITYSGDRGFSNQLRRDGAFEATVTNDTSTFISGGAGDNYVVRVRGEAYADPFQDITCN